MFHLKLLMNAAACIITKFGVLQNVAVLYRGNMVFHMPYSPISVNSKFDIACTFPYPGLKMKRLRVLRFATSKIHGMKSLQNVSRMAIEYLIKNVVVYKRSKASTIEYRLVVWFTS